MPSHINVDIAGPGATIDATTALEAADRYGMRDLMARLLPYTVTGPTFVPDIHYQLTRALASLHAGNVADAEHHLHEATQCEPHSWNAVHQPGSRTNAPEQAAGGLVSVHTYPPVSAARLATSYVFQARDHATAAGPYFLGGGNGIVRSTWRQRLRGAADTTTVTVIAVSSGRHVDDQRWRTVAAHAAATLDKTAPWAAVRRPQPDSLLVFVVTGRQVTAATRRHIAALAAAHLRPTQVPGPPSAHQATATARPPATATHHPPRPRITP